MLKTNRPLVRLPLLVSGIVLIALTACLQVNKQHPQLNTVEPDIKIMSFNIRNGKANDGKNHWNNRKQQVFDVLTTQAADVIGTQEAFRFQLDEIGNALPGYLEVGIGRAGEDKGEYSAILYRQDRFTLDKNEFGTFWLSSTPNHPSTSWGNSHLRICTWARLIDKTSGEGIYIYNTHLDNSSQLSRVKGVEAIVKVINGRTHKEPFVFMGDFNVGEDNPALTALRQPSSTDLNKKLMEDSYRIIHPDTENVGTFNEFKGKNDGPKIDYIFISPSLKVIDAAILQDNQNGAYPSDHYPVTAHLKFAKLKLNSPL